jgi:hypothetical protein
LHYIWICTKKKDAKPVGGRRISAFSDVFFVGQMIFVGRIQSGRNKALIGCYHQGMDDIEARESMSETPKHGWTWAYRKLRGLHCNRITAFYRATLYFVRGDTGTVTSEDLWQKIRLRR